MTAWDDRRYTREDMLAALRRRAVDGQISRGVYEATHAVGEPSPALIEKAFGTWNRAVRAAGLTPFRRKRTYTRTTKADCVAAVRRAATELGAPLTYEGYLLWARERGEPSGPTVRNRFGRWLDATKAAGLRPQTAVARARLAHRRGGS